MQGDRWRVSVLADGLVRLEWSEDGAFEDRASTFALHRELPVPEFEVDRRRGDARDRHRPPAADLRPRAVHARRAQRPGPRQHQQPPQRLALRRAGEHPRRHHAHARRRRRADRARSRHRLGRRCDRARRLALVPVRGRRLGQPPPRRRHRRLRLRLRPRLPGRARRVLRRLRPAARAAALGARQLVEPLPPLQRRQLPRAARPLRGGAPAVLRRGAGHGLAPRRVGAGALRLGLDGLQLGAGAVPRPRGLPHRAAPPRPADHAQRPPRRRRARLRGRLRAHGRGARPRPLHRRADRVRHHRPRVPRRLPRGPPPPARGPGRRLLVARLAAGHLLAHPGHRPAVDAQPLPLPRLRSQRPPPADVLALRGPGQPPLPDRLLGRHAHLVGVARLPAGVHRDARRTSATAGGATTSAATSTASATTSSPPAGSSSACSRRSCGCTRRTTRSWSRSRGCTRSRRAPRWATRCASATGSCPTCTP